MALISRRSFLQAGAAAGTASWLRPATARASAPSAKDVRSFHVCLAPDAIERSPELLKTVREAGVSAVWIAAYFYGHSPYSRELIARGKAKVESEGMAAHLITVPLGHPGDSLGSTTGPFPLTPPAHWKMGVKADGGRHSGTSLHEPATAENVKALEGLASLGSMDVFLDDDFRAAVSPGMVGGCYCPDHQAAFCRSAGYTEKQWADLREDARGRRLTPALRAFLEFTCDEYTASWRSQQAAWTKGRLGPMVMYLGSEKAGIRLTDYRKTLFRVGESHFDDGSFGSVKGKTDELFSSLFHRRFADPELATSETTAYPHDRLSARNLGAKLSVSTLSDVRMSMFMSGLTPFPQEHWSTLKGFMKKNREVHALVAGHAPKGPLKHYWGEASRYVGDDKPFSLFLATGVPFEVCETPASDGWTFLSDADASAATAGSLKSAGTTFVHRSKAALEGARFLAERMEDLWAFKRELVPRLKAIPFVEEEKPAVLGWYPDVRRAVLWNLSPTEEVLTVQFEGTRRKISCEGGGVERVDLTG